MSDRIENLISQMTLEEKIALLAGADMWHTVPIERLHIPVIKTTDGPVGPRGVDSLAAPTSICFPCGTALAATWNPELIQRVGCALAEEVKAKGAHILLAPTVNIHRSPLAGRNFECYSEDPFLTGKMATAYITGLQSGGVGACIKHFVCNDSEFERQSISSEVSERALREIYLRPFQLAIRDAKPWAVMSSYNRVNGTFSSENRYLLLDILKGEWGFDGIVMSDWYGTYSPNVARGGLDLEMPGPARWMGENALNAVRCGDVSAEMIDDKVRRLLHTIERAGAFDHPELQPERADDRPEDHVLARQVASEAIVLLKNDHSILPLGRQQSIAVIGTTAKWPSFIGGGSTRVRPHYVVPPLRAIQVLADSQVNYAVGCAVHRRPRLLDPAWLGDGLTLEYFTNRELAGKPVHTEKTRKAEFVWAGEKMGCIDPRNFSARLSGSFSVPETGPYDLNLSAIGKSRLFLDDKEIIALWDVPNGERPQTVTVDLVAGHAYNLCIEYACEQNGPNWKNLRIGGMPHVPEDSIQQAVALARQSDVAIVFAGLTDEWESEGSDRRDMDLAGEQNALIEQVAAANPKTIVVLNVGSPTRMPWLDKVAAVVQAWYLGQETGNAITDVLFGVINPSGKLPTTFPKRLEDNPAFINYPGENGKVLYGEGLFVGYRYYDKKDVAPLFPFGYGLSYTTFAYRNLVLDDTDKTVRVSVDVQNTGERAGAEIVQLYVHDVATRLVRPEKELKAFTKVALEPGETKTVTFTLDLEALSYYDPAAKQWVADPGEFEVLIGSSSRDIRLTGKFELKPASMSKLSGLHTGLPLKQLLEDPRAKAVLTKYVGAHLNDPQIAMIWDMSLEQMARFAREMLTPEILQSINNELAKE